MFRSTFSDACELSFDPNTANRKLSLSDNNRKVTYVEKDQQYVDHQDRFDQWSQLLCENAMTSRCYWEVEWRGKVDVSVSYRKISRKGDDGDSVFGVNDHSWSLFCSKEDGFSVCHNTNRTSVPNSPFSSTMSNRVAVYVDHPAGLLSFYMVSLDTLMHLFTFSTTFTEPLYPGFGLWSDRSGSTVCLS